MERLRWPLRLACVTCPAKTFIDGADYCCPERLDNKSQVAKKVARFRPLSCPNPGGIGNLGGLPENILRRRLKK
jgi:hypothetical protein